MPAGRPTEGAAHVDKLDGDGQDKRRLKLILEVLAGNRSVGSACRELRLSKARFHELRRQALEGALAALAPAMPGRRRRNDEPSSARVEQLEGQVRELRLELQSALVRTEVALAMPQLLKRHGTAKSKKNTPGRGTSGGSKR